MTKWIDTPVGYATFNINTFKWMAALRLDNVMLQPMTTSLDIMSQFPNNLASEIRHIDWQVLAECTNGDWRALFYLDPQSRHNMQGRRHKTLLSHVNDSIYKDILRHIEESYDNGTIREFPNITKFMRMPKAEGEVMAEVMRHVVEWLNPNPTVIVNRQRSNKPQLWQDLIPAVGTYLSKCDASQEGYTDEMVSKHCRIVEDAVMTTVRKHIPFFTKPDGKETLKKHLKDDPTYYEDRFSQYEAWNELNEVVGNIFHHHSPLPWGRNDTIMARVHNDERITTSAIAIMNLLHGADWIGDNSVLNDRDALEVLSHGLRNLLYDWTIDNHRKAGQPYLTGHRIRKARAELRNMRAQLDNDTSTSTDSNKRKEPANCGHTLPGPHKKAKRRVLPSLLPASDMPSISQSARNSRQPEEGDDHSQDDMEVNAQDLEGGGPSGRLPSISILLSEESGVGVGMSESLVERDNMPQQRLAGRQESHSTEQSTPLTRSRSPSIMVVSRQVGRLGRGVSVAREVQQDTSILVSDRDSVSSLADIVGIENRRVSVESGGMVQEVSEPSAVNSLVQGNSSLSNPRVKKRRRQLQLESRNAPQAGNVEEGAVLVVDTRGQSSIEREVTVGSATIARNVSESRITSRWANKHGATTKGQIVRR